MKRVNRLALKSISHHLFSVSIIFAVAITLTPSVADAATWFVPQDAPTIQGGIDIANPGDTIVVADGTYTGDGNRDIDFLGKPITVRSASGDPSLCIIDCAASVTDIHRGFIFQSGETNDARLDGFTITGGFMEDLNSPWPDGLAGAIFITGLASPTLTNLNITDNQAQSGGAVFVTEGSSPVISDCRFLRNNAWWGSGGAMHIMTTDVTMTDCLFDDNFANQAGGALTISGGELILHSCEFYNNLITSSGGGLEIYNSECQLYDCTFAGNTAGNGGAIANNASVLTMEHCTLVGNISSAGSAIGRSFTEEGTESIFYSVIAFNGPGQAINCSGENVSLNCSDLFGNEGGNWVDCISDQLGAMGNISEDPLFCYENNPEQPYTVSEFSPCAPENYPCSRMGAWIVGCGVAAAPDNPDRRDSDEGLHKVTSQAAPNPCAEVTTIHYSLATAGMVTLEIVDVTGRIINQLAGGRSEAAGDHEIQWDGTDSAGLSVPAGVYFYRLAADGISETKRIVIRR
jgi:FlgD Ig-like domain